MTTLAGLFNEHLHRFPDPSTSKLDAEWLVCGALNVDRQWIRAYNSDVLSDEQVQRITDYFERRIQGEPVAYILGEWEFYSLPLYVTPDTLVPRPETECLVERVVELNETEHFRSLLDLGTGSGAIPVAIKKNLPKCAVVATDISDGALDIARKNAARHQCNIQFYQGSWFEPIPTNHSFDVIVSNPPYVAHDDPHLVQGDLPYEPISALTAGEDEFADLKHIIENAKPRLRKNGRVLVEHGYDQGDQVREFFVEFGYENVVTHKDLSGNDRFSEGVLPR